MAVSNRSTNPATANTVAVERSSSDMGRLVLRLTLGVLILFHGVSKLIGGIGFLTAMLAGKGMPGGLGYLVFIGEVVAPVLLIVGLWTRPAALVVVLNMLVAVTLAHSAQFFNMTPQGGYQLELQAFYLFTALAIALLGAGRFSVGGAAGKWN